MGSLDDIVGEFKRHPMMYSILGTVIAGIVVKRLDEPRVYQSASIPTYTLESHQDISDEIKDKMEDALRDIALKNAAQHGGNANPGAVIGAVMGANPEMRPFAKIVKSRAMEIVEEVNSMSEDEFAEATKDLIEELEKDKPKKKKKKAERVERYPEEQAKAFVEKIIRDNQMVERLELGYKEAWKEYNTRTRDDRVHVRDEYNRTRVYLTDVADRFMGADLQDKDILAYLDFGPAKSLPFFVELFHERIPQGMTNKIVERVVTEGTDVDVLRLSDVMSFTMKQIRSMYEMNPKVLSRVFDKAKPDPAFIDEKIAERNYDDILSILKGARTTITSEQIDAIIDSKIPDDHDDVRMMLFRYGPSENQIERIIEPILERKSANFRPLLESDGRTWGGEKSETHGAIIGLREYRKSPPKLPKYALDLILGKLKLQDEKKQKKTGKKASIDNELLAIYEYQNLDEEHVGIALELDRHIPLILDRFELNEDQILSLIERNMHVSEIFSTQKLGERPIMHFLTMGYGKDTHVDEIYTSQKLTDDALKYCIHNRIKTSLLYRHQRNLEPKFIALAVGNGGDELQNLFAFQRLTDEQIVACIKSKRYDILANIEHLFKSSRNRLTQEMVQLVLDGNFNERQLEALIEGQPLNEEQQAELLSRNHKLAMTVMRNQKLPEEVMDGIIEDNINDRNQLSMIYTEAYHLTEKQRVTMMKALYDMRDVPKNQRMTQKQMKMIPDLWRRWMPPTGNLCGNTRDTMKDYLEAYTKALDEQVPQRPLEVLAGIYPLQTSVRDDVIDTCKRLGDHDYFAEEEDFEEGNYNKAYYFIGDDKKSTTWSSILNRIYEKMKKDGTAPAKVEDMRQLIQSWQQVHHALTQGGEETEQSNWYVEIITDPAIHAVRTNQYGWNQGNCCDKWGGAYNNPKNPTGSGCNWYWDVVGNNAVALLRRYGDRNDPDNTLARLVIRWCLREDEPVIDAADAYILGAYSRGYSKGMDTEQTTLVDAVRKIVRRNGFSGGSDSGKDNVRCKTPYKFIGWEDSTQSTLSEMGFLKGKRSKMEDSHVVYYVGARPS